MRPCGTVEYDGRHVYYDAVQSTASPQASCPPDYYPVGTGQSHFAESSRQDDETAVRWDRSTLCCLRRWLHIQAKLCRGEGAVLFVLTSFLHQQHRVERLENHSGRLMDSTNDGLTRLRNSFRHLGHK